MKTNKELKELLKEVEEELGKLKNKVEVILGDFPPEPPPKK